MKKTLIVVVTVVLTIFLCNCSTENLALKSTSKKSTSLSSNQQYLALGDSYTIGQSVCETCSFPQQLQRQLANRVSQYQNLNVDIIARTGWTTTQLIDGIKNRNPDRNYDLVTLLIGVNNQFQNYDFELFEKDFIALVSQSIVYAKGNKKKVIVLSIPDYTYTPFGQMYGTSQKTSIEINRYNDFAEHYCKENAITFINITDITREGLKKPNLVTKDGLHPSTIAYTLFVERILPEAMTALNEK